MDRPSHVIRTLARDYGLTPAEARLVSGLVQGKRLREIASEVGVSMNTIRTQLKSVFRKTDTHRQVDLVRMALTRSPGLLTGSRSA